MFRRQKMSRSREAQHVAEQAWEQMVAAFEAAADAARAASRRTSFLADEAQSRASSAASKASAAADEARKRAGGAIDALAGRRPSRRWEWAAGAAVAGLMIGWLAAAGARRAVEAVQSDESGTIRPTIDTRPLDSTASPEY